MQETQFRPLGQEDLLEESMATHSSILAWGIPWTEETGKLQFIHDWKEFARTHECKELNTEEHELHVSTYKNWKFKSLLKWQKFQQFHEVRMHVRWLTGKEHEKTFRCKGNVLHGNCWHSYRVCPFLEFINCTLIMSILYSIYFHCNKVDIKHDMHF